MEERKEERERERERETFYIAEFGKLAYKLHKYI